MTPLHILTLVAGYLICAMIAVLGFLVLREMYNGNIDLSKLISEPNGDASMSRFQFLVFTFVIAFSLFLVVVATLTTTNPRFPDVPTTILTLLGISGSSYLVSKGIQFSDPAGLVPPGADITVSPQKAAVRYGQAQPFKADVPRKPNSKVHWAIMVPVQGGGEIDQNGVYKAPDPPTQTPDGKPLPKDQPYPTLRVTIQATSDEFPDAYDLAVVTVS